jgi:hypothetical protein
MRVPVDDLLGWVASLLTLVTFAQTSMIPLRVTAILANVFFHRVRRDGTCPARSDAACGPASAQLGAARRACRKIRCAAVDGRVHSANVLNLRARAELSVGANQHSVRVKFVTRSGSRAV